MARSSRARKFAQSSRRELHGRGLTRVDLFFNHAYRNGRMAPQFDPLDSIPRNPHKKKRDRSALHNTPCRRGRTAGVDAIAAGRLRNHPV